MFSSPASAVGEPSGYDFQKEENAAKWKGVFVNSLRKVHLLSFRLRSTPFYSAPCRFIHLSPTPSHFIYLSLYLCLSLSFSRSLPSCILLSCLLLSRSIPSTSLPPLFMFCSLQRSIIFRPNDFTSRLDRSTTPTDVIAVRGHHMISQMPSCQHRLVHFFISYPRALVSLFSDRQLLWRRICPKVYFVK